ncbi:hypothetical protein [Clostridium sp. CF012]|nr:hypothetical protein [Clostridium sp. CF012]MBU3146609.1 hypothetical protein [Clostridium sp. CF012]
MYFEELSIEEKVDATINYIKNKKEMEIRGQEEADRYIKKSCRKRARMK